MKKIFIAIITTICGISFGISVLAFAFVFPPTHAMLLTFTKNLPKPLQEVIFSLSLLENEIPNTTPVITEQATQSLIPSEYFDNVKFDKDVAIGGNLSLEKDLTTGGNGSVNKNLTVGNKLTVGGDIHVNGTATFAHGVNFQGTDLNLGNGALTAANVLYSVASGSGIIIGSGQNPTITNTGVLSLQNQTGNLSLTAGSGIYINGLTIQNTDLGSAQNIFKNIAVSGQSTLTAGNNNDTLNVSAGSGITLTTNGNPNTLTIAANSSSLNVSGWTHTTGITYVTNTSDNVGIGTTTPTATLDVAGTASLSGNLTFRGLGNIQLLNGTSLQVLGSPAGDTGLSSTPLATISATGDIKAYGNLDIGIGNANFNTGVNGLTSTGLYINGHLRMSDAINSSLTVIAPQGGVLAVRGGSNESLRLFDSTNGTNLNLLESNTSAQITTNGQSNLALQNNGGQVGIGTASPLGQTGLDIEKNVVNDALLVNQSGAGAIFTASQGGNVKFQVTNGGNIAVNGGSITTTATTANIFNVTPTTLNIGGNATTISMGASTGTTTINNSLGLGTTSALGTLDIRGNSGTLPVATVSGKTSFAALTVNNDGVGPLFSASFSGWPRFNVKNDGSLDVGIGNTNFNTGSNGLTSTGLYINGNLRMSDAINSSLTAIAPQSGVLAIRGGINESLRLFDSGNSTNFNLQETSTFAQLNTNGQPILSMQTNGGTVGMGTTTPLGQTGLDIEKSGANEALLVNQTGTGAVFTASKSGTMKFQVTNAGNVVHGNAALATNATDGFLYLDASAGAPSGTPTSYTGTVPMEYDTTNNKLMIYNGGWKTTTAFADYAEWAPAVGAVSGDVVTLTSQKNSTPDDTAPFMLGKATTAYDSKTVGVVSQYAEDAQTANGYKKSPDYHAIALVGRVPVKVSSSNGTIQQGDYLTSSSIPGVAQKATKAGVMIGKALEDYTTSDPQQVGQIMVLVNVSYADPTVQITDSGNLSVNGQVAGANPQTNPSVTADQFNNLSTTVANLQSQMASQTAQLGKIDDLSKQLADLEKTVNLNQALAGMSTQSAVLGASTTNEDTIIGGKLSVSGRTLLGDVGITGVVNDGLLTINGMDTSSATPAATINTLSAPLKMQSLAAAGVDFENGKVTIDTDGNLVMQGNITAKTINADKVQTGSLEIKTDNPDAATVGEATIPAGQTKLVVKTTALTDKSQVFVTVKGGSPIPVSVIAQTSGTSFTVMRNTALNTDTKFSWWVVNEN